MKANWNFFELYFSSEKEQSYSKHVSKSFSNCAFENMCCSSTLISLIYDKNVIKIWCQFLRNYGRNIWHRIDVLKLIWEIHSVSWVIKEKPVRKGFIWVFVSACTQFLNLTQKWITFIFFLRNWRKSAYFHLNVYACAYLPQAVDYPYCKKASAVTGFWMRQRDS